jgi:NAD(P)-dependent dehydrogenase (short-subunit alcohol dehydrogenase family)
MPASTSRSTRTAQVAPTGRLAGKVAIVTGAASGIGAACARLFAAEGAAVLCTDLDVEAGTQLVDAIGAAGGKAVFTRQDVVEEAQWVEVMSLVLSRFGALHVLVNNAGIAPAGGGGPVESRSFAQWKRTLAVDLDSVFLGCKHAIGAIRQSATDSSQGSIINISSVAGLIGLPNAADYCAAKAGVRLLTKSVALECAAAGYRIRVNSVHPGYILTGRMKAWVARSHNGPDLLASLVAQHPIGFLGEPEDVAAAILYLASDESRFMTGSELVIDGGFTL